MRDKRELRLVIWQFVRTMVELENSGKRSLLYCSWEKEWMEIDKQLYQLRNEDHKAYADLMMNQEVVLKVENVKFWSEIRDALMRVNKNIDRELKVIKQNDPRREDLMFERRELRNLCENVVGKNKAVRS